MNRLITIDITCVLCDKTFSHQTLQSAPHHVLPTIRPVSQFFGIDLCRSCDEELFSHYTRLKETKRNAGKPT